MNCSNDNTKPLWPIYPAESNFTTTVGSTTLVEAQRGFGSLNDPSTAPICQQQYACATGNLEVPTMANNTYYVWSSGGGLGVTTPLPSYQVAAAQNFINVATKQGTMPPPKFANYQGRQYPDLSSVGDRILIVANGGLAISGGTSASTPIWAAVIALLNDARAQHGKKPLGFLNPLLYKMYSACGNGKCFQKVVGGNNNWSRNQARACTYGYTAIPNAFDPVTGFGSPNYLGLKAYVLSLP